MHHFCNLNSTCCTHFCLNPNECCIEWRRLFEEEGVAMLDMSFPSLPSLIPANVHWIPKWSLYYKHENWKEEGGGGINEFGFVVLTIVFENLLNVWFLSFVYIYREREREFKFDIFQSFLIDVFIWIDPSEEKF